MIGIPLFFRLQSPKAGAVLESCNRHGEQQLYLLGTREIGVAKKPHEGLLQRSSECPPAAYVLSVAAANGNQ